MEQKELARELAWVPKVDPNKVYDVLVKFAGANDSESSRQSFVSCWVNDDWREWKFGGDLFYGKIWREERFFRGEGYVPELRVSCALEYLDDDARGIIHTTNTELRKVLFDAGLRLWP